jgi:hypothetical protein
LDFFLPGSGRGVEYHGAIHKRLNQAERARNDERKRAMLAELGVEVLWIDHTELGDVLALAAKIREFAADGQSLILKAA